MLFKRVKADEVAKWYRVDKGLKGYQWEDIVGIQRAVTRMGDTSIFRVLEWGGLEVA